jgi:hypothetical protein
MGYLPQSTILGRLKILEVYEFYDIPRLFCCQNAASQRYLALSIDEEEFSLVWLYVAISPQRFQALCLSQITLRDAYLKAEDDVVLKVVTCQDGYDTIELVHCPQIPDDWLPAVGELLSPAFETALPQEKLMLAQHH